MSTPKPGKPEAASAIWDWPRPARTEPAAASARRARWRGALRGAVVAGIAVAVFVWWSPVVACVAWGAAAVLAATALVSPTGLYATLERGLAALGWVTGRCLNWVILVPVFYLVFAPFGQLLRRGARDRLQRGYEPGATTYWVPHRRPDTTSPWERQF